MKSIHEMTSSERADHLSVLKEEMDRLVTYSQAIPRREFDADFNRLNSEILAIENLELREQLKALRPSSEKWAVCLDSFFNPNTWGKIRQMSPSHTTVIYGKDAPIWTSDTWDNKYIRVVETEEEAKQMVKTYEASVDYDPR